MIKGLICGLLAIATLPLLVLSDNSSSNSTFVNPVLPGWHSDPSCINVDTAFFCVTSTFISFPGLPIYAPKDLINWKLIGHAWNRESQLPGVSWNATGQKNGMCAATIRYKDGSFYVICENLGLGGIRGTLFKTKGFWLPSWNVTRFARTAQKCWRSCHLQMELENSAKRGNTWSSNGERPLGVPSTMNDSELLSKMEPNFSNSLA